MRITALFIAAAFLSLVLPDAIVAAEPDAGRESLFLLGAGARAVGMGGAYVAVTDDATAVYWNPARISVLEHRELSLMHVSLYEETSYDFAAVAWPILNVGTVGVGGIRLGSTDIEFRDVYGPLGNYDYAIGQYWMSYGRRMYGPLCAGASLKLVTEGLGEFSASAPSLDVGLSYNFGRVISIGANIQDILSGDLKLSGVKEEIPSNIKFGFAAGWMNDSSTLGFTVAGDMDRTDGQPVGMHLGGEIMAAGHLYARIGFDREYLTFGGGIRYKLAAVDYAYKDNEALGGSHRLSLALFFGPTISEQSALRTERAHRDEIAGREAARLERADELWRMASEAFDDGELDSAMVLCSQVLGYDSDHREARARLIEIRQLMDRRAKQEIDVQSSEKARLNIVSSRISAGMEALELGKLSEARVEFGEVLKIDPDNIDAKEGLMRIELEIAKLVDAHRADGEARFTAKDYGEAIVAWSRALELKPDQADIMRRIEEAKRLMEISRTLQDAMEAFSNGNISLARELFDVVLQIDANNRTAIEYIDIMNREDIPVVQLQELKSDQEFWDKYVEGLRLFRNKQYEDAIEVWQAVLDKYPGSRETRTNIEQARLRMEQ